MKKNQKGFSIIETLLIVVILCASVGIGWYIWHATKNDGKSYTNPNQSSTSSSPRVISESIPANWKNYENKDLGVQFAYPNTWNLKENKNGSFSITITSDDYVDSQSSSIAPQPFKSGIYLLVSHLSVVLKNMNADNFDTSVYAGKINDKEIVSVNGSKALQFKIVNGVIYDFDTIFFKKDNTRWNFSMSYPKDKLDSYIDDYNRIISSVQVN